MNTWKISARIPGSVLAMLLIPAAACLAQTQPNHPAVPAPAQAVAKPAPGSAAAASVQTVPPQNIRLSPWATEIVKLDQAGINIRVMLAFIDNTPGTFNLGAEQMVYLHDLGISDVVVTAMLQHDADIALGWRSVTPSTVPGPAPQLATIIGAAEPGKGQPPAAEPRAGRNSATQSRGGENRSAESPEPAFSTGESPGPQQPAVHAIAANPSPRSNQPKPAAAKSIYPVREPYPVQLTPPILVVKAWRPPANLVVIDFSN